MNRKLVQHGESTLMLSLPAHWLREKGLKKGDALELVEQDGALVLRPEKGSNTPVNFDARKLGLFTKRALEVHYKLGYDHIETHLNPEQVREVQTEMSKVMPGYEIVDQKEGKYTIKDISGSSNDAFEPVFRKIMMITVNFAETVTHCIEEKKYDKLAEARVLEDTLNKLSVYALRLLNKWGYPSKPSRTTYVYMIIWLWENIGDQLKFICDHFVEAKKPKLSSESIELLKEVTSFLRSNANHIFKYNPEQSSVLSNQRKELIARILSFNGNKDEQVLMHNLHNMIQFAFSGLGMWLGTVY